jgi:hypothetical protein
MLDQRFQQQLSVEMKIQIEVGHDKVCTDPTKHEIIHQSDETCEEKRKKLLHQTQSKRSSTNLTYHSQFMLDHDWMWFEHEVIALLRPFVLEFIIIAGIKGHLFLIMRWQEWK